MTKKHRLPATCAFLVCMCLTLWAAFSVRDRPSQPFPLTHSSGTQVGNALLVIFFFVLQLIALLWYAEQTFIMCAHKNVCLFVCAGMC